VIKLKKRFLLGLISIFTISTLLFAGCSNSGKDARNLNTGNNTQQALNTSTNGNNSTIKKDSKNIADSDLINSASEDSPALLTSVDAQSENLSSDEIDSLLDDNSNLNIN
jgi:purine-nucleoside phosphorylase